MAESNTITTDSPRQLSESDNSTTLPTMDVNHQTESNEEDVEKKKPEGGISLRIWPPTQKTRDAVVNGLIQTLSTDSILSKRYGALQSDEASTVAKSAEEEAYAVASAVSEVGEGDGTDILQIYTKEISKCLLDSMKARTTVASPTKTVANGTELTEESNAESTDSN